MKYFILKPKSKFPGDPYAAASRKAMIEYAACIRSQDSRLADDLSIWAEREMRRDAEICFAQSNNSEG
jgi:hypothetical protein